eukprot:4856129-Heterocapsa_arctica.AAC.1
MRNAMWRLARNRTASLARWYDMTNTFASVIKTQLDAVLSQSCTRHDAVLLGLRHNLAKVFIKGPGDDLACFSTGCGDMQ